jgi:hypothetical protein
MKGCMKRITLGVLALLTALQCASAAPFTIAKSWTTVRARPSADAPALALVFGNDTLDAARRQGAWVAVRLGAGRLGWVLAADGSALVPQAAVQAAGAAQQTPPVQAAGAAPRPAGEEALAPGGT